MSGRWIDAKKVDDMTIGRSVIILLTNCEVDEGHSPSLTLWSAPMRWLTIGQTISISQTAAAFVLLGG